MPQAATQTRKDRLMNEDLGVPLNLLELLKGDWRSEGWVMEPAYLLHLVHGSKGLFPAIFTENEDRPVVSTDLYLLKKVWNMLPRQCAAIHRGIGYTHHDLMCVYFEPEHESLREQRMPIRILTQAEYKALERKGEVFCWAPGLFRPDYRGSAEMYAQTFIDCAKKLDPAFKSAL